MIVRTRGGANHEMRSYQASFGRLQASRTWAGTGVTVDSVLGLPAVSAAIRLISETVASMPFQVYSGQKEKKKVAESSWQNDLLTRRPDQGDSSPFDLVCDIAASVEVSGNAYVMKVKNPKRTRVEALWIMDPSIVTVSRDEKSREKRFKVSAGGQQKEFTGADILHVRGFTVDGCVEGISPIALHRNKLGWALALDEFEGRFFSNGARPGGVIEIPGNPTPKQVEDVMQTWEEQHSGLSNAHRPALLHGGWKWVNTSMSLEDSQFIETQNMSVDAIARIFRIPVSLLDGSSERATDVEQETLRFLVFSLMPRLRRIEAAFSLDEDLFGGSGLYPEFDTSALLRTDAATRATVRHSQIQDGTLLADEARAEDGRPPLDEVNPDLPKNIGKIPQIVPVGGTPHGVPGAVTNGQVPAV